MNPPDPSIFAEALEHAPDGVAVVETDGAVSRLVYLNATLSTWLGQPADALCGRPLQEVESGESAEPRGVGTEPRVQLRRADGSMLECERRTRPLAANRRALFYRPVARTPGAVVVDRGGLSTPEHLIEVLRRDWSIAQRDGRALTLMRFDVDGGRDYLEVFGRGATENVLRQVGRTIAAAMRRTSDVVARFADGEFVVLALSMEPERGHAHAELIVGRVRDLAILHPRSPTGRYLTVSAGVVNTVAPRGVGCEALLEAAQRAVSVARSRGGNRAVALPLAEAG